MCHPIQDFYVHSMVACDLHTFLNAGPFFVLHIFLHIASLYYYLQSNAEKTFFSFKIILTARTHTLGIRLSWSGGLVTNNVCNNLYRKLTTMANQRPEKFNSLILQNSKEPITFLVTELMARTLQIQDFCLHILALSTYKVLHYHSLRWAKTVDERLNS